MAMTIHTNLMAMNVARNLNSAYDSLATSTQRLSSGLRINSAADDAAGLAIRELMRSEISTMQQGIRNANDAISMIQTADGALQVIDEKLIRMKELAEQAATGTYNSDQRLMIESEYQAMASEIERIANATEFNGVKLLDGTLSARQGASIQSSHDGSGLQATGPIKVHFGTGNDCTEDYYYINIGNATATAFGLGNASALTYDPAAEGWTASGTETRTLADGTDVTGTVWTSPDGQEMFSFMDASGQQSFLIYDDSGEYTEWRPADGYSISTQENAQRSLNAIEDAIISKDKIRAALGAYQNRLENTISNLEIQAENLSAAESQISDVDVSTEMTEFVKNQITTQAAVAMLSQANSLPQMALQLIQG